MSGQGAGPTIPPAAWFEDFVVGGRWSTGGYTFSEGEVIDFAFRFDPQPFHIDAEAAKASMWGGLIVSGFHTLSVAFRLVYQSGPLNPHNIGGKGIDEVRWHRAVRPGDTIRVDVEVLSATASKRQPDRGTVVLRYNVANQHGAVVLTADFLHVVACRP
ncbi:acyl dehydratase [Constrictibacter sp. MBR-5]|jgi:acyl dehydratase|uniref:MaoC family dehydratase n=1 Tax=Constrictibacter sp. MBR-5 TaxID=3156467 RepID=UPI0033999953